MEKNIHDTLKDFSKENPTLILSTCNPDGQPHSCTIYFAADNKEPVVYFFSKAETQKVKNISRNPKVALLTHDPERQITLQMEGLAREITSEDEYTRIFNLLIKTLSKKIDWPPPAGKISAGRLVFYKVQLTWARLGHFKDHEDIFTQLLP